MPEQLPTPDTSIKALERARGLKGPDGEGGCRIPRARVERSEDRLERLAPACQEFWSPPRSRAIGRGTALGGV